MSRESIKQKLRGLTADQLAEALLEVAGEDEVRLSKVQRLVSDEGQNRQRFERRLKNLIETDQYVNWRHASEFADELSDLIEDIKRLSSPDLGFSLICQFYGADAQVFERCDDSSGSVGSVFSGDAFEVFCHYAKQVTDRGHVLTTVLSLLAGNDYGARDEIGTHAHRFLTEPELRKFFDLVAERKKQDARDRGSWAWQLESIAEQLKDAPLYEKLVLESMKGEPNTRQIVHIASVYLAAGDSGRAQKLLDQMGPQTGHGDIERQELQKKIYQFTENIQELTKLLSAEFRLYPSLCRLQELLAVVGEDHRAGLIEEIRQRAIEETSWDRTHARFFHEIDDGQMLNDLVLKHATQIEGRSFYELSSFCESLEDGKHFLAASILYRALIESTLEKAKSKYYHHAVGYLQKLDQIDPQVDDWVNTPNHAAFLIALHGRHRLKKSFWSRYGSENKNGS